MKNTLHSLSNYLQSLTWTDKKDELPLLFNINIQPHLGARVTHSLKLSFLVPLSIDQYSIKPLFKFCKAQEATHKTFASFLRYSCDAAFLAYCWSNCLVSA